MVLGRGTGIGICVDNGRSVVGAVGASVEGGERSLPVLTTDAVDAVEGSSAILSPNISSP